MHKFGGAALADAAAVRHAARIAADAPRPVVAVASAMRGVTDALLAVARAAAGGDRDAARAGAAALRAQHAEVVAGVAPDAAAGEALRDAVAAEFDDLDRIVDGLLALRELTPAVSDLVVARGERVAARCLTAALGGAGVEAVFVDATAVVRADARHGAAAPDLERTAACAAAALGPLLERGAVPVVPGFLAGAPDGATVTLGRGGSDLTATVLAAALRAPAVVLWKDVPGFLTADPRVVPEARLIPVLHAREAAELAYYGAKVLHPRALVPIAGASGRGTRVFVRPLADPAAPGTEIVVRPPRRAARRAGASARAAAPVKALSAVAEQALVTIAGAGMIGVPGMAARAFVALERAGVSVSLISQASSEQSICLVVPGAAADAAERALAAAFAPELARREVDAVGARRGVATVAIVGLGMAGTPGVAGRLFDALGEAGVNVVAIAQGASELNISVVVDAADAAASQRAVHAAFRLDKIGGGSPGARHPATPADVVLLGFGSVGRAVARQLAAPPARVRVVAVIDRSGYVFDPRGLSPERVAALARAKRGGAALADQPRGTRASADAALGAIAGHALSRPVLVDLTAGDTGAVLEAAVRHGMDLVLANKRPLADDTAATDGLARAAAAGGRRVLHEATVGAGLPLLDTLHKLRESGDRVLRIEGCPSGTLGYLFGELGRGVAFSDALGRAMALGYTEPDPRDDLSGADVARKAIILARLLGWRGEPADVPVESLVPAELRDLPLDAFLARALGERALDAGWAARVAEAAARGLVLRYRVSVSRGRVRVGLAAVPAGDPLANLSGTDNQFSITTRRYRTNPLVITGPGAGVDVTAGGVVNDVLKLAGTR
ncbi:bifunctional aspartokinase I/homoserine dehydrogenase I [Gemmatimonadetes bacterium T265]|nr:bifunctional aspartokinase I/homoserine dehydrogenase I [Gemmatimonadetes bacterium T265]